MKTTIENNILYIKENNQMLAYVTFPFIAEKVVNINHTFTAPQMRGKGLAKILLDDLYNYLKEKQYKAVPTCSYAVSYFERYPEKKDVL